MSLTIGFAAATSWFEFQPELADALSDECAASAVLSLQSKRLGVRRLTSEYFARVIPTNKAASGAAQFKDSELCSLSESTRKTGSPKQLSWPFGRVRSPPHKAGRTSAQLPREPDVPAGRAGGRTAEAPEYAAEATPRSNKNRHLLRSRSPASGSRHP